MPRELERQAGRGAWPSRSARDPRGRARPPYGDRSSRESSGPPELGLERLGFGAELEGVLRIGRRRAPGLVAGGRGLAVLADDAGRTAALHAAPEHGAAGAALLAAAPLGCAPPARGGGAPLSAPLPTRGRRGPASAPGARSRRRDARRSRRTAARASSRLPR